MRERTRSLILLGLACTVIVPSFVAGAATVPYWDDWEVCRPLLGTISWPRWIVEPHVDHVMPLPRLLLVASTLSGFVAPQAEQVFGAFCLLFAALGVANAVKKNSGGVAAAMMIVAVAATNAWENVSMGWQFHLLLSFALVVRALLVVEKRPLLATLLCWLAAFCYAGALAALPLVLVASLRVSAALRTRIAMAAVWACCVAAFFALRSMPSEIDSTIAGLRSESGAMHEPGVWILRAVQLLGAAFLPSKPSPAIALVTGGALLVAAAATCVQRRSQLGALMTLTAFGYCLAVAWGRFQWGEELLIVSRYFTFPRLVAFPIVLATRASRVNLFASAAVVLVVLTSWVGAFPLARKRSVENERDYCAARIDPARHLENLAQIAPNPERAAECLEAKPALFPDCPP